MYWYNVWICLATITPIFAGPDASDQTQCYIHDSKMYCRGRLPETVPPTVKDIDISHVHESDFYKDHFQKWTHIESLSVDCRQSENKHRFHKFYSLASHTFNNMTKLRSLKISSYRMDNLSTEAFSGLEKLKVLDFTDCRRLSPDQIARALTDKLPSLVKLILRRIGLYVKDIFSFGLNFFQSLQGKRLTSLDLSGTKFRNMHERGFVDALPHLVEFNVSEGGYLTGNLMTCFFRYGEKLKTLRSVDISFPNMTFMFSSRYIGTIWEPRETFVQNLTTVFARGIAQIGWRTKLHAVVVGYRLCVLMYFLPNNASMRTLCLPKYKHGILVQRLSLTHNAIEDIDESITSEATDVRYFDVSHNRLCRMDQFRLEKMLQNASRLTEFYATNNEFSVLPYRLFRNNTLLQVVDLSHNNLVSIEFHAHHLLFLRVLKLNHNKLLTIDAQQRLHIDALIVSQVNKVNRSVYSHIQLELINLLFLKTPNISVDPYGLRVELFSNPLECSCDNTEFFEWIDSVNNVKYTDMCGIGSENPQRDSETRSKLYMHCKRPFIIAFSSGGAAVCIAVIIAVIIVRMRKRKVAERERHLKHLIQKYEVRDNITKYPVFLSYSSNDDQFLNTYVVNEMNARLQALLNTDRQCVATGDATFRPGFYVAAEIIKYIELSEVVVFCVSNSFCKSPWCIDEIYASHYLRKPIVLMFLEEVKLSHMPKILQTFFNRFARSKWVKEEDTTTLQPDWETVCHSIVELMNTDATSTV